MKDLYQKLYETGIIPVIKIDDAENAVPLAKALIDGGLPAAEITFRTAAAADAIKAITQAFPDMLVGAGTVLTPEQADAAKAAGAQFIVSPGLNPKVVKHCIDIGIPMLPGCSNPSDIEAAIELGLDVVKFFPAEAAGGLPMLKAMAAPYGNIRFMPTGGLNENNILNYLSFDKIKSLTENAVKLMLGFKIKHVGINSENAEQAMAIAKSFAPFGLELKDASIAQLGRARQVKVNKENTIIVDGAGDKTQIKERVNQIRAAIETTTSEFDKEKLLERLAKLAGGVAVIQVGAATEVEMKEKKLRIEDALSATKAAVEEGILPGGGTAYINVIPEVEKLLETLPEGEKIGARIILKALEEPVKQIARNAGLEGAVILEKVKASKVGVGFDAAKEEYTDMKKAGIVDPTKVTRSAIQNAESVASMILTTESIITEKKEKDCSCNHNAPGMADMGGMY